MYKDLFNLTAINFEEVTKIPVDYVKQYGNGSYLWLYTDDNDGVGVAYEVHGYLDASNILDNILAGYKLKRDGHIC